MILIAIGQPDILNDVIQIEISDIFEEMGGDRAR